MSKCVEVSFEAIPGSVVQMWGLLATQNQSSNQSLSWLVSICTAAFTIASIDFKIDAEPNSRVFEPSLFVFVPDNTNKRSAILVTTIAMSVVKMAGVVLAFGLLGVTESKLTVGLVIGCWVLLGFIVKAARRDPPYFMPTRGVSTVVAIIFQRMCTSLLIVFTDFFDTPVTLMTKVWLCAGSAGYGAWIMLF